MKNIIIVVLFTLSTFCLAQTININSTVFSTNGEKTFPIWVEAGTTIQPNSPIKSISVKEFNVIPNSNGNDLVFNKTILVYNDSLSTVPAGKSWKLESIQNGLQIGDEYAGGIVFYLDGNGGGKVAAYPTFQKSLSWAEAVNYCGSFEYKNLNDWYMPSVDELNALFGLKLITNFFDDDTHWSSEDINDYSNYGVYVYFSNGERNSSPKYYQRRVCPIRQF